MIFRCRTSSRALLALVIALCSCRPVYEEQAWVGLTERQITGRLGDPTWTTVLTLSRGIRMYAYRGGLSEHVPTEEGRALEVKEMGWKGVVKTTVVWLVKDARGEWVVVETVVWLPGVRF